MSEIKTSAKGIDYAKPCVLKTKSRVYSQAVLMKIPHEHHNEPDISLKIGRYLFPFGKVQNEKPKSELTLDNEELNALISYISENYVPVNLGSGKYINVSDDDEELINKFKELVEKNWFSENKWVLGSDFAQIIDERNIDTENIADYIMRAFDGFVDLVEIKKPNGLQFWSATKDHNNYVPSTDLVKAITQCLNYIYAIEREANSVKFIEKTKSKVIKPRCILIFGRSNDWNDEQREAYRILNAAYNQISILTYDHLLFRAKNVLGITEDIDTTDDDELPF